MSLCKTIKNQEMPFKQCPQSDWVLDKRYYCVRKHVIHTPHYLTHHILTMKTRLNIYTVSYLRLQKVQSLWNIWTVLKVTHLGSLNLTSGRTHVLWKCQILESWNCNRRRAKHLMLKSEVRFPGNAHTSKKPESTPSHFEKNAAVKCLNAHVKTWFSVIQLH